MTDFRQSSISLLLLLATSFSSIVQFSNAGKGKVPIYMPIPIPIPMPVLSGGGGDQGGKTSHYGGGDGDVKKVYLLQPMQPHQGFSGSSASSSYGGYGEQSRPQPQKPQTTHQHSPQTYQHQHHQSSSSYGGDSNFTPQRPLGKTGGGHDGVKILPIVMIPPMPSTMQPMHLQPSSHAYIPIMSASNGYSGAMTRGYHTAFMPQVPRAMSGYNQDQRSFSEYGGGRGASLFRENFSARSGYSSRMRRQPSRRYRGEMRPSHIDEQVDDYKMGSGDGFSRPRQKTNFNQRRQTLNGFRDASIEQQKIFDDDLDDYGGIGSGSGGSFRDSAGRDDCCHASIGRESRGRRIQEMRKIMQDADYDPISDQRQIQMSSSSSSSLGSPDMGVSESFNDLDGLLSERVERKQLEHDLLNRLVRHESDEFSKALGGSPREHPNLMDGGDSFLQLESRAHSVVHTNVTSTALAPIAPKSMTTTTTKPKKSQKTASKKV